MKSGGERHRRSIRLPRYDYAGAGAYFVTICAQNRQCVFGDVADGEMVLNDAGRMVQAVWQELPRFYPGVGIDTFQIMPNHIHGIIILVGATPRGCPDVATPRGCPDVATPRGCPNAGRPQGVAPTDGPQWGHDGQPFGAAGQAQGPAPTGGQSSGVGISLSDAVHRFKTMTTRKYADGVKQDHWPPFPGKLWQRNYYEHVVRNDKELSRIREYLLNNPRRWHLDRENPNRPIRRK